MKEWSTKGVSVKVQFKNPLLVGKGNDNVSTSLKNPDLFAPASGAKALSSDEASTVAEAAP
jgi:hypothetical protein